MSDGHCTEGARCVCGGDLPSVRAGCHYWRASAPKQAQETSLPPQGAASLLKFVQHCSTLSGGMVNGNILAAEAMKALAASPAPAPQEPADVGQMEYRGNTVSYMYDRARAYGEEIMRCWFALKDAGLHPGRTDDRLSDMLKRVLRASPAPGELGAARRAFAGLEACATCGQPVSSGPATAVDASAGRQDAASDLVPQVRRLLWGEHPECCGSPVEDTGAEYMGRVETVLTCCGSPDYVRLNDAQIVASLRALLPESPLTQQAPSESSAQGSGGEKA